MNKAGAVATSVGKRLRKVGWHLRYDGPKDVGKGARVGIGATVTAPDNRHIRAGRNMHEWAQVRSMRIPRDELPRFLEDIKEVGLEIEQADGIWFIRLDRELSPTRGAEVIDMDTSDALADLLQGRGKGR